MNTKKNAPIKKTAKKKHNINTAKPKERELVSFDFAVKYLLRDKKGYVVLSGFLSELLGKKVEVISLSNVENIKVNKDAKTNRVDLKATINGGEIVVFEIQFQQEFDFLGRMIYGVCCAVVDNINAGDYYEVKKVYSINIAYCNLGAKREYLFSGKLNSFHGVHYKDELIPLVQAESKDSEIKKDIHPEYYLILPRMFDEKMRSRFDEWVYVLKNSAVRDDFTAAGIKEAKVKLDYLRMTPEKRKEYLAYLESRRSANSMVVTAKAEGKEEGRDEERIKNIKNMYKHGIPIVQIAPIIGIPVEDIKRIVGLKTTKTRTTKKT